MSSTITLEALHILDAIERRGSFAAAAQELNRAPSSLSYQIQKLEQDLDLVIFDRSGHRANFTEAGKLLLERGRLLISAAQDMVSDANVVAHGWELDLTIAHDGIIPVSTFFPLVEHLGAVSKTRIKLQEEILAGGWEALATERADLLVCPRPETVPQDVKIEPIGKISMTWVAAHDHYIHKRKGKLDPEARKRYRVIAIADTARDAPTLSFNILDEQPVLTVTNFHAKIEALIAGIGIGTIPTHIAERLIEQNLLAPIAATESAELDVVLAWRRNKMGKSKSWCIQYIKEHWKLDYSFKGSLISATPSSN
ncbi:LysR family transcriptional regulator [Vibrio sp. SCSIO 43136]|uniref:LysR family transcriptional regulator n=1 Tax=Vibrio sp. SCSIO 43136 TaxID=2819101 RepID=UPI0020758A78|nr:LysR family transcriptional regulator [Vibrio sp. SCSIO 43136]USD68222.1 LysR family transcriptional regulator [Vibrio sp. SCSIO 43136]